MPLVPIIPYFGSERKADIFCCLVCLPELLDLTPGLEWAVDICCFRLPGRHSPITQSQKPRWHLESRAPSTVSHRKGIQHRLVAVHDILGKTQGANSQQISAKIVCYPPGMKQESKELSLHSRTFLDWSEDSVKCSLP